VATASTMELPQELQSYQFILVSLEGPVGIVQLNRPDKLNAISIPLMTELVDCLTWMDNHDDIRCIIITGNERAFAAGADIEQMAASGPIDMLLLDQFAKWDQIRKLHKPIIAAVSGFVLGGGCELAMTCDMIVASETTKFGQPEINLGVIPGAGGTQRLTRAVGKARAMEMVLTGRMFSAQEALEWGLVNKVAPVELYLHEAKKLAHEIASKPPVAARMAKESVLKAFDTTIEGGLDFERKAFYLLFASADKQEGMRAFLEKRKWHPKNFKPCCMTCMTPARW
jgi:enoyl-CoA hydratase